MKPTPLHGLKVLEFAGLAPAPFCGLLCSDYGADVVRIDRPANTPNSSSGNGKPTPDILSRRKRSICIDLKSSEDLKLVKRLIQRADVLIEPFRPGVMERVGLGPEEVMRGNERLVYARLTGFRRDGRFKDYLAVSGVLNILGPPSRPLPPANILADFAAGGAACFTGILLALIARQHTNRGQVVQSSMVDGAAYLATFPRLLSKTSFWNSPRGMNMLDGGRCPYYRTYETKDGGWMAVGALELQFFRDLVERLQLPYDKDSDSVMGKNREDKSNWEYLSSVFAAKFKEKTRKEWEAVFDGSDACCTPVKTWEELEAEEGHEERGYVGLSETPGFQVGSGSGMGMMIAGQHQKEVLREWLGEEGRSKL